MVNVGSLDQMAEEGSGPNGENSVDLRALGYGKLLGTGRVTRPLKVRVLSCSESALRKIRDAGGQVLVEAKEKGE